MRIAHEVKSPILGQKVKGYMLAGRPVHKLVHDEGTIYASSWKLEYKAFQSLPSCMWEITKIRNLQNEPESDNMI